MNYYDKNGQMFFDGTVDTDMTPHYEKFLKLIPENSHILDAGCGSGRDTKSFMDLGYTVTAIDGSKKMCELAGEFTNVNVYHMQFQEIEFENEFDGIWAHLMKMEFYMHHSNMGILKVSETVDTSTI